MSVTHIHIHIYICEFILCTFMFSAHWCLSGLKSRPQPYPTLVLRGRNKCETHHLVLAIGRIRNATQCDKTCQQTCSERWTLCTCTTHDIYSLIVCSHVRYISIPGEHTTIKVLMEIVVYLQMLLARANVGLPTNTMAWSPTQAALLYD